MTTVKLRVFTVNNGYRFSEGTTAFGVKLGKEVAYSSKHMGDLNRKYLLKPAILGLMGEVKCKKVLDAGCGEGYFSRLLSKRGAQVTGIDYSQKMIEVAREKTPPKFNIDFIHENYISKKALMNKGENQRISYSGFIGP